MQSRETGETLNHLFRRESGRITAYLTRFFGPDHLDLAESVVQTALLKAVQTWPTQGIPENPGAWILRAARNEAIDEIRKRRDLAVGDEQLEQLAGEASESGTGFEGELEDDQLKLLFICCHPGLGREARLALTLKVVCGFSTKEVARAFLAKEESVSQRILRAKQSVAEQGLRYEVPPPEELGERLDSVLEVLYLLFNEGYLATSGEDLLRRDLCEEAIFRTTVLSEHSVGRVPKVHALLALMHFHCSRFGARTDSRGEVLLLEEQDRSLWDQNHIRVGAHYLALSAEGAELTEYHLQAGIASCHALAPSFAETPWGQIVGFYDLLLARRFSPVVALNRAVAVAMGEGPEAGLGELAPLEAEPSLRTYYLLPAAQGELHRRAGRPAEALNYYRKALTLVGTEPERRLIEKRIRELPFGG
jgi:RNA polymerase sigma-70 factor (ECF subfamily)